MNSASTPPRSLTLECSAQPTNGPRNLSAYLPIRDYALIGDCHGCALVSRAGSIDWCAFGRFDAPPVFCRLLDADKGGFTSITPTDTFETERTYLDGTNILRTVFKTARGSVAVVDYMPVGRRRGAGIHDYVSLAAPGLLVRMIEGLSGRVTLDIGFRPSVDYGRTPARLVAAATGVFAEGGAALQAPMSFSINGDLAHARYEVGAGERRDVIVSPSPILEPLPTDAIGRMLAVTRAFWSEWIAYCRYDGPCREMVRRGALALKLLTYGPSGAIIAAATTSLPEEIGGERNWDYRFCWLRDATFTLYALAVLGYSGEAKAFNRFLRLCCRRRPADIQIVYGIGAETELHETLLDHLEGYAGSGPVRIGNAAYKQRQADVYGEVVDWAHLMSALGAKFDAEDQNIIERLVSSVAAHADDPDQGLWEARSDPRHYVHGKMMSWVALDRGLRLLGEHAEWRELRDRLRQEILEKGIDPVGGHLLQAYHQAGTDAAVLLAPMIGFPLDRTTLERTVAAVDRELRRGDYVDRYRTDDGLPGREGAFLICSFWLVDAYLALGRGREAHQLFERLLAQANDVGLLSEEIDQTNHAFLGNFPQAFTHLALIGNAIHFDLCAKYGSDAVAGTYADRARRAVGATFGWRALWEACKASGRVGRFWSSRRSILPAALAAPSTAPAENPQEEPG